MIHMHRDYLAGSGYGTSRRCGIYVNFLRKQLVPHNKKHHYQAHDEDFPPRGEFRPLIGLSPNVIHRIDSKIIQSLLTTGFSSENRCDCCSSLVQRHSSRRSPTAAERTPSPLVSTTLVSRPPSS